MPEDKSPAGGTPPPAEHSAFFNPFEAPDPQPDPPIVVDLASPPEPAIDPVPEPAPASMAMTKAELLERVQMLEAELTKAKLLERIETLEGGGKPAEDAAPLPSSVPMDPIGRTATINGVRYQWTESTQDTVPEEARAVWARGKAAGGL